MSWVAVAVGGSAIIGAGASYLGSKKQADAAKGAANLSMEQYRQLRADQMPYMQGGYGGLAKLNTLLGINPRRSAPAANDGNMRIPRDVSGSPIRQAIMLAQQGQGGGGYAPTGSGGIRRQIPMPGGMAQIPGQMRLQRLLALRAQNGDSEAARMLQQVG